MKKSKLFLASVAALMMSSSAAIAEFPERTIENIFPWSAGKALSVSQIIAKAMGEELGVSLPVVSTPGAAGTKAFKTAMGSSSGWLHNHGWICRSAGTSTGSRQGGLELH